MIGLPRGWAEATLDELVASNGVVTDGDWVESKDQDPNGEVRLTQLADVGDGEFRNRSDRYLTFESAKQLGCTFLEAGDVLIARMPDPLGRACIFPGLPQPAVTVVDVLVFRSGTDLVSPHWMMSALNASETRQKIIAQASGTTRQRISGGNLKRLPLPVPPLPEQKRIVAKLDALSAKSARARTKLSRIETLVSRYKQAVLSKAFSEVAPRKAVGELVARIKAGRNLRCEERPPHLHEKGVVKVSAVTWGEFRADQSKTLPPDFTPDEETRISPGDFLFSRANTIELVGAVVVVAETPDNLYLSDKILRLEFNEPVEAWLLWYLRSPDGREALMNISSGNQLSMRNIGQKSLLSLSVPYADSKSRNEIVRRIESAFAKIDRLAIEAKRALKLLGKLDEAVLAKAFRGELVPQDEADEPASVLLERIKQARNNQPAKSKRTAPKRHGKVPDMARTIVETLVEAKDWLNAQELFARCGVRDGSSTEDVEKLYRQLLELERQEKLEIEEVLDPSTGDKQGNRVRLRK